MIGFNFNLLKSTRDGATISTPAIASAVEDYLVTHPVTVNSLAATKVTTDSTHRFITDTQLSSFTGKASLADVKADSDVAAAINNTRTQSQLLAKNFLGC